MRALIEFLLGCPFWSIISQFGCEERVHSGIPPLNWKLGSCWRLAVVEADQGVVERLNVGCSFRQRSERFKFSTGVAGDQLLACCPRVDNGGARVASTSDSIEFFCRRRWQSL
jgi:hypothetical protein